MAEPPNERVVLRLVQHRRSHIATKERATFMAVRRLDCEPSVLECGLPYLGAATFADSLGHKRTRAQGQAALLSEGRSP
jgi:hypothetical protein